MYSNQEFRDAFLVTLQSALKNMANKAEKQAYALSYDGMGSLQSHANNVTGYLWDAAS